MTTYEETLFIEAGEKLKKLMIWIDRRLGSKYVLDDDDKIYKAINQYFDAVKDVKLSTDES